MEIILKGEPQSTGHIYRSHCKFGYPTVYLSKAGKTLKEDYQWQAKSQWKQDIIKEKVALEVKIFFGKKRKQDIDNFNKLLFDSLTGIVWEDDSQIYSLLIEKDYCKENPRIEIAIKIK